MSEPPRPSRRSGWLAGAAAAAVLAVASLLLSREPPPAGPPPSSAETPAPATARAPAGTTAPVLTRLDSAQVQVDAGQGVTTPSSPQPPDPGLSSAADDNPPIAPEQPQTPEWKLQKTAVIAEALGRRSARLEEEIQEAEARGDKATAAERRILLERSRKREAELKQEISSP